MVQITPLLCWRLPDGDLTGVSRDLTAMTLGAERHEKLTSDEPVGLEQVERFGLLPTPNIATPILKTLILPETFQHQVFNEPGANFLPTAEVPGSSISVVSSNYPDYGWPRHKHRRKIKINGDGAIWSNFPKTKQIVEIVPIRHKTKKGKALAYIVPKSHSVKKQLEKRKKIPGKVVDRNMKNFSQALERNEENMLIDGSESKLSDFDSDSIESISFEDLKHQTLSRPTLDDIFSKSLENTQKDVAKSVEIVHDKNDDRSLEYDGSFGDDNEEEINYKLNHIVSYFNDHSGDNLDKLIHNILPDDVEDPKYHVHYIIHKKRRPNHHNYQENKSNMTHHNNLIKIKPKTDNNNQKFEQTHVYTRPHNHEYTSIKDLYNPVKMIESNEKSYDSSIIIKKYDVGPVHDNKHHYHQPNHDAIQYIHDHKSLQHSNNSENDRNVTLKNNDKSDLEENVQELINGDHPDFSEVLDEIKINPRYAILNQYGEPMIHHINIYGDYREDVSNQSDDQDTYTSESESHEIISDEEDSFEETNELSQAEESYDSTVTDSSTDSEHDSDADISLDSGTLDTNEIEYQKPIESREDSSTEENTNEHNILETLENSTSSVSVENTNNGNGVYDISDLTEHNSILPNCFHLKKKHSKKCDLCERNKSFTLTFLFNR